jgi:hypothetical protein
MNDSRLAARILPAALVLLAVACQDVQLVTPDPAGNPRFQVQQVPAGGAPDRAAVARAVPGFGGIFLDADGVPTVHLMDPSQRGAAQSALAVFIREQGYTPDQLRVLRGDYDYLQLDAWFERLWRPAFEAGGIVLAGVDERRNRVIIGVESASSGPPLRALAARLGVPTEALIIEEMEPVRPMTALTGKAPSIMGGYQINFPGYLCTLGFLALHGTQESFVTNSHCTSTQGGTEATPYYQPTSSVDPTVIGIEVDDPEYWRGDLCPRGNKCRYSDSARIRRESNRDFSRGYIARTSAANNGSLEVTGSFEITGKHSQTTVGSGCPVVGTTLNKVGRTTGWTAGAITHSCVHVGVLGSNIAQLYQVRVEAGVGSGDSGSPVFGNISGSNVTLYGILWGGGSSTFVYSPLVNVEHELGTLTVTKGGASTTPTTGTISGKVTDAETGNGISGATVSVDGKSVTTSGSGAYSISGVAAGTHNVTASKNGYHSQTKSASVTGGETTTVDFALAPISSGGGEAGTVSVTSISYSGHGGPASNRHLTVTVWVEDDNDVAVSGASVSITLQNKTTGASWNTSGTTGSNGSVGFTLNNAPNGTYETTVMDVSASGLTWDGVTPANSYTK